MVTDGGGYLLHRELALQRGKVECGIELRPLASASSLFRDVIEDLHMVPIVAADFKTLVEQGWNLKANGVAGREWYQPASTCRLRALLSYKFSNKLDRAPRSSPPGNGQPNQ